MNKLQNQQEIPRVLISAQHSASLCRDGSNPWDKWDRKWDKGPWDKGHWANRK